MSCRSRRCATTVASHRAPLPRAAGRAGRDIRGGAIQGARLRRPGAGRHGAASGRVATLLIEADRHIPGRLDPATGAIEFDDLADPEVDDLLDDVAEAVLRTGGEVVVVPAERMPTQTGIAAIYRF